MSYLPYMYSIHADRIHVMPSWLHRSGRYIRGIALLLLLNRSHSCSISISYVYDHVRARGVYEYFSERLTRRRDEVYEYGIQQVRGCMIYLSILWDIDMAYFLSSYPQVTVRLQGWFLPAPGRGPAINSMRTRTHFLHTRTKAGAGTRRPAQRRPPFLFWGETESATNSAHSGRSGILEFWLKGVIKRDRCSPCLPIRSTLSVQAFGAFSLLEYR